MIRVNLLPIRDRLLHEAKLKMGITLIVSTALGLFAVGLHGFLKAEEAKAQRAHLSALQSELTQLEPKAKAIRKAKEILEQDQRLMMTLKSLDGRRLSLPHFLFHFSKDLFPEGWVESLRLKEDTVEVQLFTVSQKALSALHEAIEGYPSVAMVRASNPKGVKIGDRTFFKASLSVRLGIKEGLDGR